MYKVKFGGKNGKTINLVESKDLVAIRTKNDEALKDVTVSRESRELIKDSTEVASFPEAGITIRRVNDEGPASSVRRRDETRAALKQEDNIRFAGRVLQDAKTGEVMLYTENFFIKFKDGISEADCLAIMEKYKLKIKSKLAFAVNAWFVEANEGTGLQVFEIADQLLKERPVEYCHPELVQERRFKSINPLQWHLAKTTIGGTPIDAHINIEKAWKITRGQGVSIAIIDDGIDLDHPEFAGRIRDPFDATDNNDNPRPKTKEDNHGTACAGMACASGLPAWEQRYGSRSHAPAHPPAKRPGQHGRSQRLRLGRRPRRRRDFLLLGPHRRGMVEPERPGAQPSHGTARQHPPGHGLCAHEGSRWTWLHYSLCRRQWQ